MLPDYFALDHHQSRVSARFRPSLSPSPEYIYQKRGHRPELTYLYSPLYKRVQHYFPSRERSTIRTVS